VPVVLESQATFAPELLLHKGFFCLRGTVVLHLISKMGHVFYF